MADMDITCINCPLGCRMRVALKEGAVVSVAGNACPRGAAYARQECADPRRVLTAVIPVSGSRTPLSVKTRTPVPKAKIADCMAALSLVRLSTPIEAGTVVLADVCGTGCDFVATRSLSKEG